MARHSYSDLIRLFNDLFLVTEHTVLVAGTDEPLYVPARDADHPAQIIFAHGYYASALHEIAHWCIAGAHRRTLLDYGYWYVPDGRSAEQQLEFSRVEVKPQAIEWVFSVASGLDFNFSADNLASGGSIVDANWRRFQDEVATTARYFATKGLPTRAEKLANAIAKFYGTETNWRKPESYRLEANWREVFETDHRLDEIVRVVSS